MKKEEKDEKKKSIDTLAGLRDKLQKGAKGVHISLLSESDMANINTWIPFPAYDLNRILSGSIYKGVPEKNFVFVVGPEASFKSSFAALIAAKAEKEGFKTVLIDTEGTWKNDFVQRWGLNPETILYIYAPWVDDVLVALGKIIDSGARKLCIILDSIGNLGRRKAIDDALDGDVKADQGSLQKDIKVALKMLLAIAKAQESIAIGTGHYYGNPGKYGGPEEIGGGKHVRITADIIMSLKKSKIFDADKTVIGTEINATTLKNRYYPPFNEAVIEIDYANGVNKYAGLLDIALDMGVITQAGAWYTIVDTGEKFQGKANFVEFIQQNETDFLDKVEAYIKQTGYSTVNEALSLAQELVEEA